MERQERQDRPERDRVSSFTDMKVWQEAHALVIKVFQETPKLPSEQQEGLAMMMERTALEVPKNIAEGFKRRGSRNKAHYYDIARSTLEGLRYCFILCKDLNYALDFDDLQMRGDQVSRMLDGLVRSMARTSRDGGGSGGRGGRGGRGGGRGGRRDDGPEDREIDRDFDDRDDFGGDEG